MQRRGPHARGFSSFVWIGKWNGLARENGSVRGASFELGRVHFRLLFLLKTNRSRAQKWTLPSSKLPPPHRSVFRASQAITCQFKRAMKEDARVIQIAAACSKNHSGPFGARFRRMVRFFRMGCFPTPSPSFGAILGKRYSSSKTGSPNLVWTSPAPKEMLSASSYGATKDSVHFLPFFLQSFGSGLSTCSSRLRKFARDSVRKGRETLRRWEDVVRLLWSNSPTKTNTTKTKTTNQPNSRNNPTKRQKIKDRITPHV